jgi:hypothetical protein
MGGLGANPILAPRTVFAEMREKENHEKIFQIPMV